MLLSPSRFARPGCSKPDTSFPSCQCAVTKEFVGDLIPET